MIESEKELYEQWVEEVCLDISVSKYWRELLFSSKYNEKFLIDGDSKDLHYSTKLELLRHDLTFYVSKVDEEVDECFGGTIVFKFEATKYPDIVRYSGN